VINPMFSEAFPILTVRDMQQALAFYRELLGFEVTYRFPPDGEPAYVGLRLGESQLGIGVGEVPPASGTPPFAICTYSDDCDAAVERLRAGGVHVLEEPVDQPWGERMARVADPDGIPVVILSRQGTPSDAT
jgi:lactoylglutathione lyase